MTTPERTWKTARTLAKQAAVEDAQVVFADYASDPAVSMYMTWEPHRHIDETTDFLRRCERRWAEGSEFTWTLWTKDDEALAGILSIRMDASAVHLGYALARRWWRQGLMSEALKPVIQWALAQPTIYRVWATCDIDNVASARLLEHVGMEREGLFRRWLMHPNVSDIPRDCLCYSIVKAC